MDGLRWIDRHGSLALSPRIRLVDEVEADALRRKREQLQWRPRNGFLLDENLGAGVTVSVTSVHGTAVGERAAAVAFGEDAGLPKEP